MSDDREDKNKDDDNDDDNDDDELRTLRDKAAALACYGAVSGHCRAVARSVIKTHPDANIPFYWFCG